MPRLHGGALALAALIACAGCAEGLGFGDIRLEDTLHFDESASGIDSIDIEAFNGAIRVTGDDSDTIDIVATRVVRTSDESRGEEYARRVTVDITIDGDTLNVRTAAPSDEPGYIESVSVEYAVSVPRRLAAFAASRNGAIDVTGLDGAVDAETKNGAVTLVDIRGEAKARTSNGKITLDDVTSVVEAKTSNGAVSVRCETVSSAARIESDNGGVELVVDGTLRAPVTMSTTNGKVTARVRILRDEIELSTSNGAIDITVLDTLAGGIDARTSIGAIDLHVPRKAGFRLDATSGSASISTPWGSGDRGFVSEINGGGPEVTLRTSSGSVRITE
ncbi:DUF4097 family beta strand repeat protein [Candidatus Poribacteria bacterium]|jgi:DUF4097 and DUF4098 domain-containing protein YvlB|nr:DUF4097 family beta strand repeat protein [Candidatus Poribacteria bacterium]MBT5535339.1 DUF4097 family beta strand repeat protein [Candidatus Poribacteria bacterium]MBT5709547.1 DUF4097 family beta strand repeat protein [Candidatus Poribacteria bacterium]MBT7101386.1 DUF4097 family beta strand repeat protein [Candidatus Poribacteria bacterium]MBT7806992.1 DUF4097 family beta strand repeat protein [Candidatus Poribacteria bacterium]